MLKFALERAVLHYRRTDGMDIDVAFQRAAGTDDRTDCHLALAFVEKLLPMFLDITALAVRALSLVSVRIDTGSLFDASDDVIVENGSKMETDALKDVASNSSAVITSEIDKMTSQVSERLKSDLVLMLSSFQCVDVIVLQQIIALFKGKPTHSIPAQWSLFDAKFAALMAIEVA